MERHVFPFQTIWILNTVLKLKDVGSNQSNMDTFHKILLDGEYYDKKVNTNLKYYCLLIEGCIQVYTEQRETWNERWNYYLESFQELCKSEGLYLEACELIKEIYSMMENVKDKTVIGYDENYTDEGIALILKNKN